MMGSCCSWSVGLRGACRCCSAAGSPEHPSWVRESNARGCAAAGRKAIGKEGGCVLPARRALQPAGAPASGVSRVAWAAAAGRLLAGGGAQLMAAQSVFACWPWSGLLQRYGWGLCAKAAAGRCSKHGALQQHASSGGRCVMLVSAAPLQQIQAVQLPTHAAPPAGHPGQPQCSLAACSRASCMRAAVLRGAAANAIYSSCPPVGGLVGLNLVEHGTAGPPPWSAHMCVGGM